MKKTIVALGAVLAWVCGVFGATHEGVQLWENGPLWAKTNIGANSPTEAGYYFWWGDTLGYKWQNNQWVASDGSKTGYSFASGNCPPNGKTVAQLQSLGYVGADGNLLPARDAAAKQWGDDWRVPKASELKNLFELCTWAWTTNNNVTGYVVTGKGLYSGNSVFLPVTGYGSGANIAEATGGYYWGSSATLDGTSTQRIVFGPNSKSCAAINRHVGFPIRPVKSLIAAKQSAAAALDTRTGTRTVAAKESIAYDAAWGDATSGTLTVNGTAVSGLSKTGTYAWTPNTSQTNYWKFAYKAGTVNYSAIFQSSTYTVKYNANGGSGSMASVTGTYGQSAKLTTNAFSRPGYAFLGWTTTPNGTTIAYKDGQSMNIPFSQSSGTLNLYAKWTDTWYVNAATGNDANEGASAAEAFKTIQRAIDVTVPGMTIVVADGTYAPINSGNKSITIRSVNGAAKTVIDGGYPAATNRCVFAGGNDGQTNTVIRGFTIQNGCTIGLASLNGAGVAGGTLHNCIVRANHGGQVGGGVAHSLMFDCEISDNETENGGGGAYRAYLNNCQLLSNRCKNDGAGAYGGILNDCTIASNRAELAGGGVCNAVLTNCVVRDNVAISNGGGASIGSLYGCTVTNNIAYQYGGGVNRSTVENSILSGNEAYVSGGGAYLATCTGSEIRGNKATQDAGGTYNCTVVNCVLVDNEAGAHGGGVLKGNLENCLVYGNRARTGSGGGVAQAISVNCTIYGNNAAVNGGGATMGTNYNCIVYGNVASAGMEINVGGLVGSVVNCCTNDPHFIRAEAGDFRLRCDSPCIDAGDKTYVTNTVDFAGNPRVVNNKVDIGAYEFSAALDQHFTVQVANGTGGAIYYEGDMVTIEAEDRSPRYTFTRWTGDVSVLKNVNGMTNTFTMPTRNLAFTAEYDDLQQYLVIDLSGGVNATSYPVSYLTDVPAGGWTDTYKTTKLVMRRIDPGTFTKASSSEVTLTHPYYIGVFELTQRQWELVMGTRPSAFSNTVCYATRPVEKVSYNQIRGADLGRWWPQMNAVDEVSFMGKLRAKTGRLFDLPTEAQWEYACRAGTTTDLNTGKNLAASNGVDGNMAEVGRYYYNSGRYNDSYSYDSTDELGTAKVGSYVPNAWGLYDMHGNVNEFCLDWYLAEEVSGTTDPVGPESGTQRSARGGSWGHYSSWCKSSVRGLTLAPNSVDATRGLRPVINFANFSLNQVVNLQASNGTEPNGVRLTWTAVPGATEYTVYNSTTENFADAQRSSNAITTNSYLSAVNDTNPHWYWVQAVVDGKPGTISEVVTGYRVLYSLTVTGGSGSTNCLGNTSVTITAAAAPMGYSFKEWTGAAADVALLANKAAASTTITMPGRAVTLTATYQPNAYAVTFNANGGTGTMADESFVYDTAKALTANAFTRTGYTFKGWATSASGAVVYAEKASVKNLTASAGEVIDLFAVWEINRHSVTVTSAWGEGGSATYDYGSTVTLSAPGEVIDAKGTTKYVCLGSSAYPEAGTNVTLTVTGNVDFAWDVWQTNYWVSVTVEGPGAILENGLPFEDGWRAHGDELVLTAAPNDNARFIAWTGDLEEDDVAEGVVLALTVLEPRSIGASFGQTSYKVELNAEKMGDFATTVAEDWVIVTDPTAKYAGTSVKSAVVEDYSEEPQESVLRSTVRGPGTFSFWWRSSCDEDPAGEYTWDHGELRVDGEVAACIDGITDWRQVCVDIVGDGMHTIEWVYAMDGFPPELEDTEDCIWIDAVNWTGANAELPLVAPVITPGNGSVFTTETCTVTITCESPRAVIYYSTNGRTPSLTETYRYTGPFTIDKTTTVTAVAVRDEEKSAYVKAVLTQEIPLKHYTIAYAANGGAGTMTATACTEDVSVTLPESTFTRQGYSFVGWALEAATQPESVDYHPGDVVTNLSAEDGATVTLYAVWTYLPLVDPVIVPADGTMFAETCQVTITCESADAVIYCSTSGRTPSLTETYRYTGPFTIDKTTSVTAVAVRGDEKSAYVKAVISKQSATQTSEVSVPFAWLREKYPTLTDVAAFEAKSNEIAANGVNKVWECYVAGLDPTDPTSLFQSKISLVDGKIVIEWTPYLNESATSRIYTVYGRKDLREGDWETPIKPSHKFFKVKVSMPTGTEGEESDKPGVGFVPKEAGH